MTCLRPRIVREFNQCGRSLEPMNKEKRGLRKLTLADKVYISSVTIAACFTAAFGAYGGHLWIMAAGIMFVPIAFIIRFPRQTR